MNNNFRIFVGDGTKGGARRASMYKVSKSFAQKFRNAGVSFFFSLSFFFPIFILIVCAPSKLSRDESANVQQVQRGKYTRVCINSRMKISSLFSSLEKQLFETACVCVCRSPFPDCNASKGVKRIFFLFLSSRLFSFNRRHIYIYTMLFPSSSSLFLFIYKFIQMYKLRCPRLEKTRSLERRVDTILEICK